MAEIEPFFSTGEPDEPRPKHVLLVSYYFPPINLIGALRWQRLSAFAAARGWSMDVVLVNPEDAPGDVDEARLRELPRGVRLYTVPDRRSVHFELQRRLWRTVRPLIRRGESRETAGEEHGVPPKLTPRRQIGPAYLTRLHYGELNRWARAAAQVGTRIARERRPDWVASSGPPQSAHMAGRLIASKAGVPFLMDMRDPWCSIEMAPKELVSHTWRRLAGHYEEECVRAARVVSVTTEALRRDLASRYPDIQDRFITVMNGADPQAIPAARPSRRFTIAYAGNLYVGRDPRNLLRAVARVSRELSLTPDDLCVEFIGGREFARKPVAQIAEEVGAGAFVSAIPPQPHRAALERLAQASMLVSLPQYAHLAIPAKLFEYVQFDAWLLVLADRDSATELLFRDSSADVVAPGDVEGIAAVIRRRYEAHKHGERPRSVNHDGCFDRSRQAAILLDAMQDASSRPTVQT